MAASSQFLPNGLFVVLLWSLSSFILLVYTGIAFHKEFVYSFATAAITFPLAGWLADVYFGRYKVIHYSLWLEVAASISYNVVLLAEPYLDNTLAEVLRIVAVTALAVGLTGVAANSLQFGLDQLFDASSSDISSYIGWYSWTFFAANEIVVFSQTCTCRSNDTKVTFVMIPLFCVVALIFDLLANRWLLKEPVTHNPLKLIYQVLRYAAKNKYPRMRSAFTYWEDKPYSRIDLGKIKYGGPFTTEEVEDVKTFFRLIAIIVSSSFVVGLVYMIGESINDMMYHVEDRGFISYCVDSTLTTEYLNNCIKRRTVMHAGEVAMVILVPVAKLIAQTKVKKLKLFHSSIFSKLFLGLVLLLLYEASLLVVEVSGILVTRHNFTCLLASDYRDLGSGHVLDLNYMWLLLPQLLSGLANYILCQNGLALICSQAPYSMRGLLIGIMLYSSFLPLPISEAIYVFIKKFYHKNQTYCGFSFFLSVIAATAIYVAIAIFIKRCYVFRRRDEDIHNQHIFAVDYYDKYLPAKTVRSE